MSARRFTLGQLFRMNAGLVVWASAFVALYAGLSLGCQHLAPPPEDGLSNPVTFLLAGVFGIHLIVLLGLALYCWKKPAPAAPEESGSSLRFRHRVEGLILAVSIAALVWIAFPMLLVAPCAG